MILTIGSAPLAPLVARPKRPLRGALCLSSKFSGLRSRWMMPRACMKSTAERIWRSIAAAAASESLPCSTT